MARRMLSGCRCVSGRGILLLGSGVCLAPGRRWFGGRQFIGPGSGPSMGSGGLMAPGENVGVLFGNRRFMALTNRPGGFEWGKVACWPGGDSLGNGGVMARLSFGNRHTHGAGSAPGATAYGCRYYVATGGTGGARCPWVTQSQWLQWESRGKALWVTWRAGPWKRDPRANHHWVTAVARPSEE